MFDVVYYCTELDEPADSYLSARLTDVLYTWEFDKRKQIRKHVVRLVGGARAYFQTFPDHTDRVSDIPVPPYASFRPDWEGEHAKQSAEVTAAPVLTTSTPLMRSPYDYVRVDRRLHLTAL